MDRRTFNRSIVSGLALGASGLGSNALAAALGVGNEMPRCPACDGFKPLLGHQFLVTDGSRGTLELSDIEAASPTHPNEQFYLLFRQLPGTRLQEGIYQLETPLGKQLALHLNPSSSRPEIMEAVINLQNFA